jgi:NAD(P) transhydrogenase subunit alpha
MILQVRTAGANAKAARADLRLLRSSQVVIGFGDPLNAAPEYGGLAGRGVTSFAMELIPRITRAQSMDALSSMATIAGYKAVILAADTLPRITPQLRPPVPWRRRASSCSAGVAEPAGDHQPPGALALSWWPTM